ncbi:MAG: carbon-nitrogen hydrolase family protein [Deltaproteobacteria bacterium]|nr:carbon-nitrogen hydrolase family protein [Deltaproteobacteria bacterium]
MRIAISQTQSQQGHIEGSLAVMCQTADAASAQGAGLVIFPEMFLTGYNVGAAVFKLAEPAAGPSSQKAAAIARKAGVALLYGYPERDGDTVYNSALLIDRNGRPLANYRKAHLYGGEEKKLFVPGDRLVTAELDDLKVGFLICYDVEFPEAVQTLALAGAHLIAVPTALMEPFGLVARTVVPARAYESQVYVACANLCGKEGNIAYCGLSGIVGPDGHELARAGKNEELLIADIEPATVAAVRANNPILAERRPELYTGPINSL